ncbi:MAG: alpha/beta fold hydrolase [Candidatus Hydrogenedentes bacterium]|nr:alpha/beta fold hydrolase [Candidatus Hydrogenedentota bacterium]
MKRWIKRASMILGTIVVLLIMNSAVSQVLAAKADNTAERDPDTGLLTGAAPRTLGPEDSDKAVLFVHGFVGAGNNFNDLPDRVAAQGWRVEVMLLPGHGTRAKDFAKTTPEELIAAVEARVEELKARYETVVIVAHSMGGALATLVAAGDPVDGLVLGAPYFGVTDRWYYGLKPETWLKISRPVVPWVYKGELFLQVNNKTVKDKIISYTWVPTRALQTLMELGKRASDPEVLEKISCPVLHIHAEGDAAASPDAARAAVERMSSEQKEYVALTRSNHHIFWDYESEEVMEHVLDFLKQFDQKQAETQVE